MKLLVDEMPNYKDDCLFAEERWGREEETWVVYCKLMHERCDWNVEEDRCRCSCLRMQGE